MTEHRHPRDILARLASGMNAALEEAGFSYQGTASVNELSAHIATVGEGVELRAVSIGHHRRTARPDLYGLYVRPYSQTP